MENTNWYLYYLGQIFNVVCGLTFLASIWVAFTNHSNSKDHELKERLAHNKGWLGFCLAILLLGIIGMPFILSSFKEQIICLESLHKKDVKKLEEDSIQCISISNSNEQLKAQVQNAKLNDSIVNTCIDTMDNLLSNTTTLPQSAADSIVFLANSCIDILTKSRNAINYNKIRIDSLRQSLINAYPNLTTKRDTLENDTRLNLIELVIQGHNKETRYVNLAITQLTSIKQLAEQRKIYELKVLMRNMRYKRIRI